MNDGRYQGFYWGTYFGIGAALGMFVHWHFWIYSGAALCGLYLFRDTGSSPQRAPRRRPF